MKVVEEQIISNGNKKEEPHKKYKYIVFEGMDGCGKNTQSKLLAERLGYLLQSFPNYQTETGKIVKSYLTEIGQDEPMNIHKVKRDSVLYTLDRVHWFINKYQSTESYIFDRYYTSNILYQTLFLTPDEKFEYIEWLIHLETKELRLPEPDIVFVLLSNPNTTIKNIQKRGREKDFFEELDMQIMVYNNALYLSNILGWKVINVTDERGDMRGIEDIHHEILSHLI